MRVQHNIMAMSAYRNYTNNVSAMKKNLERLSSGYKINRAGDDAAGLAISEKMRAQITGLETAQKNAKDGISLVQTAEGALTEVHDMLNRMVELATQSANGTYDNSTDRYQLQKEMDQLKAEINRIADGANFNGIQLLDGSMDTSVKIAKASDITELTSFTVVADGQLALDPQAGVYSIDLSNLTLANVDGTNSNTIKLEVWGKTITIDVPTGANWTGADFAKAFASAWNVTDTGYIRSWKTAYGFDMTASVEGDKLVFTMSTAPSKEWDEKVLTGEFTGFGSAKVIGNNAEEFAVTMEKEPIDLTNSRMYGQAKFKLSDLNIADGTTITIGKETYVFAVGKASKYKDADNVIDLTDVEKVGDDASAMRKAADRLTKAAQDNATFKVGTDRNGADAYITLTEKDGAVDYNINNLAGENGKGTKGNATTTASDAKASDWAGLLGTGTADPSKMGKGLMLQIGDTAASYNQLKVSISDCHVDAIGIGNISIADQDSAAKAVDAIKAAINYVSDVRGTLGATQNRLDHTINNLSVMTENIQDAESTIRDTDIAEEMMAYTKNNILIQASQAMLAQANQVPQGVLQLLQ